METSLRPPEDLRDEFRRRRTRQYVAVLPVIIVMAGMFLLKEHPGRELFGIDPNIFALVVFGVIVAIGGFSFFNWRCPSCTSYLGKGADPKFCPRCRKHTYHKETK